MQMKSDLTNLLAIDVESSGPSPIRNQLLAVSLVPIASPIRPCTVYVYHPLKSIQWGDIAKGYFEKYRADWEQQAVKPEKAHEAIVNYCNGFSANSLTLVGHNAGFDYQFLMQLPLAANKKNFEKLSYRTIDTHSLLYGLFLAGEIDADALTSQGAFSHFSVSPPEHLRHTSLGDAIATAQLFLKLAAYFEGRRARAMREHSNSGV
jgi:hypothetical protein